MKDLYKIYVTRKNENVIVGQLELKTAKEIHGDDVKSISYDSKTIFLKPESPYGR